MHETFQRAKPNLDRGTLKHLSPSSGARGLIAKQCITHLLKLS